MGKGQWAKIVVCGCCDKTFGAGMTDGDAAMVLTGFGLRLQSGCRSVIGREFPNTINSPRPPSQMSGCPPRLTV